MSRIVVVEKVALDSQSTAVPGWVQKAFIGCHFHFVEHSQAHGSEIYDPFTGGVVNPDGQGFLVPTCRARLSVGGNNFRAGLWLSGYFPDDAYFFLSGNYCRLIKPEEHCLSEI